MSFASHQRWSTSVEIDRRLAQLNYLSNLCRNSHWVRLNTLSHVRQLFNNKRKPRMTTKFLTVYIIISMINTIFGTEFVTKDEWWIHKDQNGLYVQFADTGTCIVTGTYSKNCALPALVQEVPLTPTTTSTPTTALTGSYGVGPNCVLQCATQTCPGYATSTDCFCSRVGDIGYCIDGNCGIQYPTATILAEKLCGNFSRLALSKLIVLEAMTNPPGSSSQAISFPTCACS
jgi:hypothetical protein